MTMAGNDNRSLAQLSDLEVRLYKLTTRSHLRVGASEGSADVAVENPLIRALIYRNGNEQRVPYIPGSSLHGVIRAWVEKALRSGQNPLSAGELKEHLDALKERDETAHENLLDNVRQEVADFLGKDKSDVDDDELYGHWRVYADPHVCDPLSDVDKCERITDAENSPRKWKVEWWKQIERELPCAVCRIFGYMGQRGRVKVTPAWPAASIEPVPIDVITRVAINRLTGAADEGKLFDLEAIPPGVDFYFFVVLENMDGYKEHFEKGIRALHLQLAGVGAHSTIGFGMVDVKRVFTATVKPDVFDRDVEADFLEHVLENVEAQHVTDVDLDKLPYFFRALVVAQEDEKSFDDLITFE
jgi:CRISPR/Cas system CSM-associated protein Csm3 (group 7 of RAMP superfamily)